MLYGDGHVHLHAAFDREAFFAAACARARELGAPLVLLFAECAGVEAFRRLRDVARQGPEAAGAPRSAWLRAASEPESLAFGAPGDPRPLGAFVAGRQLVSASGVEVLALALAPEHEASTLADRAHTTRALVQRVLDAGGVAVLPWGFGKWIGRRGREVAELVATPELAATPRLLLGDTAQRCRPWPRPRIFGSARVLAGTDLLPFPGVETRLARYGFRLEAELDPDRPASSLRRALDAGGPIGVIGAPEALARVVRDQLRLRWPGRLPGLGGAA